MKTISRKAFSLIELMVVVAVIGILAMLAVPEITRAAQRTEAVAAGNDIRVFSQAVEFYTTASGGYPRTMTVTDIPVRFRSFLPGSWKNGAYSWQFVHQPNFTYLYIFDLQFNTEQSVTLDTIIDDGNIATGNLRMAVNGTGLIYLFRWQGVI